MKIGLVSPSWPPENSCNGIVSCSAQLLSAFRISNENAVILSMNGGIPSDSVIPLETKRSFLDSFKEKLLPLLWQSKTQVLPWQLKLLPRTLSRYKKFLDIIEMEESFGWIKPLTEISRTKIVACLHGPWFLTGAVGQLAVDDSFQKRVQFEGQGIQSAAGVIAPSHAVLTESVKRYGLRLRHSQVIPNPMKIADEAKRWRPETAEPRTVLFVGRFDSLKGGDIAIDALMKVAAVVPKIRFVFCGPDRGITNEVGGRISLEQYVAGKVTHASQNDRFEFLGFQTPENIRVLRQRAAVTFMASRWENLSTVVLEAMAMGCPFIGSDSGGTPEMIEDRQTGLLFKSGDSADLAEKLVELLENPSLAKTLGENALQRIRENFDPGIIAKARIDFYTKVLEGN